MFSTFDTLAFTLTLTLTRATPRKCRGEVGVALQQVQGILTVGEEGEIVIEPKMREWLESIECGRASGTA